MDASAIAKPHDRLASHLADDLEAVNGLIRDRDLQPLQFTGIGGIANQPSHDALVDTGLAHLGDLDQLAALTADCHLLTNDLAVEALCGDFDATDLGDIPGLSANEDVSDTPDCEAENQQREQELGDP